jgi:tetratricopeptide (TPR) repeat protein
LRPTWYGFIYTTFALGASHTRLYDGPWAPWAGPGLESPRARPMGFRPAAQARGPLTSTLTTVHNLGDLYSNQGRLTEAEQMYVRALAGREKALGPDHTTTLITVHNLGNLYNDQGKLAEAEQMYQRALLGLQNSLGSEHPSTMIVINNMKTL